MEASTSDNITVKVDTVKKEGSSAEDGILSFRFRSVDNDSLPLDNVTGGCCHLEGAVDSCDAWDGQLTIIKEWGES